MPPRTASIAPSTAISKRRAHQISCHSGACWRDSAPRFCAAAAGESGAAPAPPLRRESDIARGCGNPATTTAGPAAAGGVAEIEIEPERLGRIEAARPREAKHRDLAQFGRAGRAQRIRRGVWSAGLRSNGAAALNDFDAIEHIGAAPFGALEGIEPGRADQNEIVVGTDLRQFALDRFAVRAGFRRSAAAWRVQARDR